MGIAADFPFVRQCGRTVESAPWTLPSCPLWPVEQKANWESLVDAFGKLKVNLAFCSGPTQGNLPVWTLSRGPPGCHDAPGQLDHAWSHTEPQRFSWDCRSGWAASPPQLGLRVCTSCTKSQQPRGLDLGALLPHPYPGLAPLALAAGLAPYCSRSCMRSALGRGLAPPAGLAL